MPRPKNIRPTERESAVVEALRQANPKWKKKDLAIKKYRIPIHMMKYLRQLPPDSTVVCSLVKISPDKEFQLVLDEFWYDFEEAEDMFEARTRKFPHDFEYRLFEHHVMDEHLEIEQDAFKGITHLGDPLVYLTTSKYRKFLSMDVRLNENYYRKMNKEKLGKSKNRQVQHVEFYRRVGEYFTNPKDFARYLSALYFLKSNRVKNLMNHIRWVTREPILTQMMKENGLEMLKDYDKPEEPGLFTYPDAIQEFIDNAEREASAYAALDSESRRIQNAKRRQEVKEKTEEKMKDFKI